MKATKLILGLLGVLLVIAMAPSVNALYAEVQSTPHIFIGGVDYGAVNGDISLPVCATDATLQMDILNVDDGMATDELKVSMIFAGAETKTLEGYQTIGIFDPVTTVDLANIVDLSELNQAAGSHADLYVYVMDHTHSDVVIWTGSGVVTFELCNGNNDDPVVGDLSYMTDIDYDDDVAPGETLTIEIDLTNPSENYDLLDIKVTGWVEDDSGDRLTDKEFVEKTRIRDGDDDSVVLNIDLPADIEDDTYDIVLELEAEFDDDAKTEAFEEWTGEFEVEKADDALFVKSVQLTSATVVPGTQLNGRVEIVNTGLNDQAYVTLIADIPDLGVTYSTPLLSDIREGETQYGYFTLDIPADADAGVYFLDITAENADAEGTKQVTLSISGEGDAPGATMSGSDIQLIPAGTTIDAPIGKSGVYTITVANTGSQVKTISLDASGFENWAGLRIEPQTFTLGAGETKTANIYISPNSNANEGMKSFTVYANSNGVSVAYQTLNANITGTTFGPVENYLRWIFGAVVLLLIVLLIAYVVKGNEFGSKRQAAEIEQIYY